MTAAGISPNAKQLTALLQQGEATATKFKRSTGKLKEVMLDEGRTLK